MVPQHTKKCGSIFTRCRGFSPARGVGRAAPCSFPAAVPSAKGRATKEREPTGENANFSDNSDDSDDSDPAPPGCAVASNAQTMERGEGQGNGFSHRSAGRNVFSPEVSGVSCYSPVMCRISAHTSCRSDSGQEAPEVTPTEDTPRNHSGFTAPARGTR